MSTGRSGGVRTPWRDPAAIRRTVPFWVLLAGGLLCSGCGGGSYIRMQMQRPGEFPQPAWVGVYFLSQETALDGVDTDKLINTPEEFGPNSGVIDKEVFPVYPGAAPRTVARERVDPRIGWILVAASFPNPQPCAREKIPVQQKPKIKLDISVGEKCLTVKKD